MKTEKGWRERSEYGVVSVYTPRHVGECKLRDRNDNTCHACPRWIYQRPKGGKAVQMAAKTTSFTEAVTKAKDILKGFDPEIAAAREKNNPTAAAGISIVDCLAAYEVALGRRMVTANHVKRCMLVFNRRNPKEYREDHGRALNLSLLDFLHGENVTAREPVVRMGQLTSNILDRWSAGWRTNDSSSRAWRGKVGAFLKWSQAHDYIERLPVFREKQRVKRGNRTGHFTDNQIRAMYAGLPFVEWKNHELPKNFAARLGAFIDCGRYGGMAIIDICHFEPKVNLGRNNVLTYRRKKSGEVASVLIPPEVAARLRCIPPEDGSDPDKPFRFPGTNVATNCQTWRKRFQNLCAMVGITEVETEIGTKHQPRPHMLRDSAAIAAIVNGVSLDNVAKLLGHANSQMTEEHYLFWVKRRVDSCIEDQRRGLDRAAAAAQEEAEPEPDTAPATIN
jgi:integrase